MPNTELTDDDDAARSLDELDDGQLLALVRQGSHDAYAMLFARYRYPARRLARHLGLKDDSEDVVSESFAKILGVLRRGKGPDTAFRAYLFAAIRHESARRAKLRQRIVPTDDTQQIDRVVVLGDGGLDGFERTTIRAAYESLPKRWRTVLWQLEVEGLKPLELAPLLELSPNSISALAYRARSGLREAYLQQHVNTAGPVGDDSCRRIRSTMASFVRHTMSRRYHDEICAHLEGCPVCREVHLDLLEVNQHVGGGAAVDPNL